MSIKFPGLALSNSLSVTKAAPVDARYVVDTYADIQGIIDSNRAFEGLLIYVSDEQEVYIVKVVEGALKGVPFLPDAKDCIPVIGDKDLNDLDADGNIQYNKDGEVKKQGVVSVALEDIEGEQKFVVRIRPPHTAEPDPAKAEAFEITEDGDAIMPQTEGENAVGILATLGDGDPVLVADETTRARSRMMVRTAATPMMLDLASEVAPMVEETSTPRKYFLTASSDGETIQWDVDWTEGGELDADSTVKDSTITESTIEGSNVSNSEVTDATISGTGDDATLNIGGESTITDTTVSGSKIEDTTVSGSNVSDSNISGADIVADKVENEDGSSTETTVIGGEGGVEITKDTDAEGNTESTVKTDNVIAVSTVVGSDESASKYEVVAQDLPRMDGLGAVADIEVSETGETSSLSVKGGIEVTQNVAVDGSIVVKGSVVSNGEEYAYIGGFIIDEGEF